MFSEKSKDAKVIAKVESDGRTLILTLDLGFYGLTICESKKANKRKIINYEHLLFDKDVFENMLSTLYWAKAEVKQYYPCRCEGELLRVWYTLDPEEWIFEVFDNYYLKCPRGVKDSIVLTRSQLEDLCDAIQKEYNEN